MAGTRYRASQVRLPGDGGLPGVHIRMVHNILERLADEEKSYADRRACGLQCYGGWRMG